jgi:S1-C subfamily serine protease
MIVAQMLPGTKVAVKYIRDGKTETKEVVLAQRPDDNPPSGEWLSGVQVAPITDELRREYRISNDVDGIVITEMDESSPYQGTFVPGAVIISVNREPVTDLASAKQLLRPGRNLAFVYYRGAYRYITFVNR